MYSTIEDSFSEELVGEENIEHPLVKRVKLEETFQQSDDGSGCSKVWKMFLIKCRLMKSRRGRQRKRLICY